jgi:hypothetical protein
MKAIAQKKIFISYSWSTPEHDDWVLSLAHQLMGDGVEVVLDKWDLKEGQDKFHFMETMVTSTEIDKVLMICDRKYAEKADVRVGGVGTETQIITHQVYNQVRQEKFIPVVAEVDSDGHAFLPTYLKSLIYIDLSSEASYAMEYEKLLRNIYNRPSLSKPKLGQAPSYLLEDSLVSYKTTSMIRGMDAQLDKFPGRVNLFVKDFLAEFDKNLLDFSIESPAGTYLEIGEQIMGKLTQYQPLRDDYLHFIDKLFRDDRNFDVTIVIRFFENLPLHLLPRSEGYRQWKTGQFDHFKLISHELFIYTIAIALKHDNLRVLEELLLTKYFFKEGRSDRSEQFNYDYLRNHFDLLDHYYKKLKGRNYDNVHADVIMSRIPEFLQKHELVAGDLFCYHIGQLHDIDWFPMTYGYNTRNRGDFEFFNRLVSKRHFAKVKTLLGVENSSEFKSKLDALIAKGADRGYANYRGKIPAIDYYVNPEAVASQV